MTPQPADANPASGSDPLAALRHPAEPDKIARLELLLQSHPSETLSSSVTDPGTPPARVLAVIPARGGSKGIPRKNLRPLLGRPLLAYAIEAALAAARVQRVVVSTDDEEIALFARRLGAEVLERPASLAEDTTTLDPVIAHALDAAEERWGERFDLVLTLQPTSPLLTAGDIDAALRLFDDAGVDTVLSAVDDRHLRWTQTDGKFRPAYRERVNRQQLPPSYRETGAIIACRAALLRVRGTRIGPRTVLFPMPAERAIDVDSTLDFFLCESLLRRRHVVLTVVGRSALGLGHAYRGLLLAHALIGHRLTFVCERADDRACRMIAEHNYDLVVCDDGTRLQALLALRPDLVINDILDTSADHVAALKRAGMRVVNFEDLGLGAELADLVINALYPHQTPSERILVGADWFCLRDEFLHAPERRPIPARVGRVLLTFGGTDQGDLTCRVLRLLGRELVGRDIDLDVVTGPGYAHAEALAGLLAELGTDRIHNLGPTRAISEPMAAADLAITSAGRTVLELAALGTPTLVICQNVRETTHGFASAAHGVVNLGLHTALDDARLAETVRRLIDDQALRRVMRAKAEAVDLAGGKARVMARINRLLERDNDHE